jgi:hypothetical protein
VVALLAVTDPASGSVQAIVELRLLGGALARPGRHRSAFCHCDAAYTVTTVGALVPPVADLARARWLAALAARYDPAGVLRVGQVARYPM